MLCVNFACFIWFKFLVMNWLWYSDSLFKKKEILKLNKYHKHNLFKKNTILKKFTKKIIIIKNT